MTAATFFATPSQFRDWLDANADSAHELLVGFHKVGSGTPSMSWSDSVDEALCVGWIDGVRRRIDDASYSIRFTPRKATSIWSAINIAKMERLQAEQRMTPAGLAAFAKRTEAKSKIYAHEQSDTAELSATEQTDFQRQPAAWAYFEAAPPGYRKLLLHWITKARKPETRAARLAALVEACAAGKRMR